VCGSVTAPHPEILTEPQSLSRLAGKSALPLAGSHWKRNIDPDPGSTSINKIREQ
jgi:hypothetical protein